MGKLVVVKDDAVQGTDTHNVTGDAIRSTAARRLPYAGTGSYHL